MIQTTTLRDLLQTTGIGLIIFTMSIISGCSLLTPRAEYRLDQLHPKVKQAKEQLIQNCRKRNITIQITHGLRTFEEQDKLYAKGRTQPGQIVTNARGGASYHNYGLAIDFVVLDPKTKKPNWDKHFDGNQNGRSDWEEVGEEGKKLGFDWGGDWTSFPDYPHLEMTFDQPIWWLYFQVKFLPGFFHSIHTILFPQNG